MLTVWSLLHIQQQLTLSKLDLGRFNLLLGQVSLFNQNQGNSYIPIFLNVFIVKTFKNTFPFQIVMFKDKKEINF